MKKYRTPKNIFLIESNKSVLQFSILGEALIDLDFRMNNKL